MIATKDAIISFPVYTRTIRRLSFPPFSDIIPCLVTIFLKCSFDVDNGTLLVAWSSTGLLPPADGDCQALQLS